MTRAGKSKTSQQQAQAGHVERVAAALPDGRLLTLDLHWRGEMIGGMRLGLAPGGQDKADASPSAAARAAKAGMERLILGREPDFSGLPLCWDGVPPFTRAILETLMRRVACGQAVTYGELARLAGHPGKARAVGQAMARNPWPLVVPCHRVLGAGGALTGYTNPHGLDLKELLLRLEGATAGSSPA